MRIRVDVSGADEIRQALAEADKPMVDRAKAVLGDAADRVMSLAGPLVPVAPAAGGDLAASLRKGRATYLASSGVISVAVIIGGAPLESVVAATHHRYNIYAVLQEFDIGKGAPFHHSKGSAHFIEKPVDTVAPGIPDALLSAMRPEDFGASA